MSAVETTTTPPSTERLGAIRNTKSPTCHTPADRPHLPLNMSRVDDIVESHLSRDAINRRQRSSQNVRLQTRQALEAAREVLCLHFLRSQSHSQEVQILDLVDSIKGHRLSGGFSTGVTDCAANSGRQCAVLGRGVAPGCDRLHVEGNDLTAGVDARDLRRSQRID
jgi:hypothetical protein